MERTSSVQQELFKDLWDTVVGWAWGSQKPGRCWWVLGDLLTFIPPSQETRGSLGVRKQIAGLNKEWIQPWGTAGSLWHG